MRVNCRINNIAILVNLSGNDIVSFDDGVDSRHDGGSVGRCLQMFAAHDGYIQWNATVLLGLYQYKLH